MWNTIHVGEGMNVTARFPLARRASHDGDAEKITDYFRIVGLSILPLDSGEMVRN